MNKYKKVEVVEHHLEDLIRQHADMIEEGLVYVDHQRSAASGRLDILLVDSGRAFTVAELKVMEDDGMLLQGLDYYDYVAAHVDAYARVYKNFQIDATQPIRLFLIAPTFSQTLINRCKWIDAPISLFTYTCIKLEGSEEITPIFSEQAIPSPPEVVEVKTIEDHLNYITDQGMRTKARQILEQMREWKPGRTNIDALKYALSAKIDGRVFAYLSPRRKTFVISTFNAEDKWTDYPILSDEDLENCLPLTQGAMARRAK